MQLQEDRQLRVELQYLLTQQEQFPLKIIYVLINLNEVFRHGNGEVLAQVFSWE